MDIDQAQQARTRDLVVRLISREGPITLSELAARLELTENAVRRHVDRLETEGLIEARRAESDGRRGRPARSWIVSENGHRALASDYDHLATQALEFIAADGGDEAVSAFARRRIEELESYCAQRIAQAGEDTQERTAALVEALNARGYAASARPVGDDGTVGIQVCQGHCPVQNVAARFPQLCDAETESFSRLLGAHVQRLATLAQGDHVCTTFVPTPTSEQRVPR